MDFRTYNEDSYHWVQVFLNRLEDSSLIAKIKRKAVVVSRKVNPKNLGRDIRTPAEIYIHCLSGIFAEEVVKEYLRKLGLK